MPSLINIRINNIFAEQTPKHNTHSATLPKLPKSSFGVKNIFKTLAAEQNMASVTSAKKNEKQI